MDIAAIILSVICNFILYISFGSLLTGHARLFKRKAVPGEKGKEDAPCNLLLSAVTGFFFYYFLFFFVCLLPMKYYRPLSMLTKIWVPLVLAVVVISAVLNGRSWAAGLRSAGSYIKSRHAAVLLILIPVILQVILVSCTYNFTLDAAYYVANVATSVETNMMNVYDPFTGAWQDHYEMRYFFATYQMQDAVVCQLTGIPALIWTKSVMAVTVILLTNIVYYLIASELLETGVPHTLAGMGCISDTASSEGPDEEGTGHRRNADLAVPVMMIFMFIINLTFITIYTSSLFLMTRTYEGKAIVGNLALMTIFYLFVRMNDNSLKERAWLITFLVCFGSATISSSANMLLPVELTVMFLPMIIRKRAWLMLPRYIACVIPGIVFSLVFVLYVKGYFVWYTFPK